MKKKILHLACALAMALCLPGVCHAQETGLEGNEVDVRSEGGDIAISVAGYEFLFDGHIDQTPARTGGFKGRRVSLSAITRCQWGFNALIGTDWDLSVGRSAHWSSDIFTLGLILGYRGNVELSSGFRFAYNDYVFRDDVTVQMIDGKIVPVALDAEYRKSKLAAKYIGVPLYIDFRFPYKVNLTLMGYADFLMKSYTKYRRPVHKDMISGLNPVQLGCGACLSYHGWGIYFQYALSPLFREGAAPEAHTVSAGISFLF